ncbi:aaa-type atpase family protein-related [Anaeramoeba flamelloides]|uniref:Aaa-type atpase family protein-related n=1 Tax=Anaeramoeba flamelloides TaxID=1746091 RepID=A0AAV7Z6V3_9EUKA|nr:aaa-type atpase family protein-related [Anaeramoeba flamelloides]
MSQTNQTVWGILFSLPPYTNPIKVYGKQFRIGRDPNSHFVITNKSIPISPNLVCLTHQSHESKLFLEVRGSEGRIFLNSKHIRDQHKIAFKDGDRIIIKSNSQIVLYQFVFFTIEFSQTIIERGKIDLNIKLLELKEIEQLKEKVKRKINKTITLKIEKLLAAKEKQKIIEEEKEKEKEKEKQKEKQKEKEKEKEKKPKIKIEMEIDKEKEEYSEDDNENENEFQNQNKELDNFSYCLKNAVIEQIRNVAFWNLLNLQLKKRISCKVHIGKVLLIGPTGSQIMEEKLLDLLAVENESIHLKINKNDFQIFQESINDKIVMSTEINNQNFKIGDIVEYIGPNTISSDFNENDQNVKTKATPSTHDFGVVVATFENNIHSMDLGVVFFNDFLGGSDLGGICEQGCKSGFMIEKKYLRYVKKNFDRYSLIIDILFDLVNSKLTGRYILSIQNIDQWFANLNRFDKILNKKINYLRNDKLFMVIGLISNDGYYELEKKKLYSRSYSNLQSDQSFSFSNEKNNNFNEIVKKQIIGNTTTTTAMATNSNNNRGGAGSNSGNQGFNNNSSMNSYVEKILSLLKKKFPNIILLQPSNQQKDLIKWKKSLEKDNYKIIKFNNQYLLDSRLKNWNLIKNKQKLKLKLFKNKFFNYREIDQIIGWGYLHKCFRDIQFFNNNNDDDYDDEINNRIRKRIFEKSEIDHENNDNNNKKKNINKNKNIMDNNNDDEEEDNDNNYEKQNHIIEENSENNFKKSLNELSKIDFEYGMKIFKYENEIKEIKSNVLNVETENEYELQFLSEIISPEKINVTFDQIGALDNVKKTLFELVILPLRRPDLFQSVNLLESCKGILLFGPPGTGKTMLAKAVATESGANFINLSMSKISSKWFGEGEKYAQAVFTLAAKLAPSIIFIDEVDSFLNKRQSNDEHEASRKIKNTIMEQWDGLERENIGRVIVLASTNRPFDLDEAVIRRLPRRLFVPMPEKEAREKILNVLLQDEILEENFDTQLLAQETVNYSGSDLKNLCIAAAYEPIRDFLKNEKKMKNIMKSNKIQKNDNIIGKLQIYLNPQKQNIEKKEMEMKMKMKNEMEMEMETETKTKMEMEMEEKFENEEETKKINLRPITLEDFWNVKKTVGLSFSESSGAYQRLMSWNNEYGEGDNTESTKQPYLI